MEEFLIVLGVTAVGYLVLRRHIRKAGPDMTATRPSKVKRRPRRTKAEMAAAREERTKNLKDESRAISIKNAERMMSAGITHYRWLSGGDERVCEQCQTNDGKTFSFMEPPATGHPGQVECCNGQACRCTMAPLIKGVDY